MAFKYTALSDSKSMSSSSPVIRIADLFAGIGGLRQGVVNGLSQQGYGTEIVFTSEIKKTAVQVLEDNFPDDRVSGDITKINEKDVPDHDLLIAGFPCQAFSYAGKRAGFEDEVKGTLFFDVVRVLKEKKPANFILENVEGLINHDPDPANPKAAYGRTFKTILAALEELDYNLDWRLLVATDFGVPQSRKRVFIVGSLNTVPNLSDLKKTVSAPISSILEKGLKETQPEVQKFTQLLKAEYGDLSVLEGKIFRDWRGGTRNLHSWNFNFKGKTSKQDRELLEALVAESKKGSWVPAGSRKVGEGSPLSETQIATFFSPARGSLQEQLNKLTRLGYLREVDGKYKISSGKLSMPLSHILKHDSYANTLVATDADRLAVLDEGEIRRFSNLEIRRLFGFPDDFILNEKLSRRAVFDLFGNSVVMPMAEAVAVSVFPKYIAHPPATNASAKKTSFLGKMLSRFTRKR